MQSSPKQTGQFLRSRTFKILALLLYVYSFIQLDADESPITIEVNTQETPAEMANIRIQLERPFKILIKVFGKEQDD